MRLRYPSICSLPRSKTSSVEQNLDGEPSWDRRESAAPTTEEIFRRDRRASGQTVAGRRVSAEPRLDCANEIMDDFRHGEIRLGFKPVAVPLFRPSLREAGVPEQ